MNSSYREEAQLILLRFGELALKGRNRHRFEQRILSHIYFLLEAYPEVKLSRTHNRIYIELNGAPYDEIASKLDLVFGLSSYSPVYRAELDLDNICQEALRVMTKYVNGQHTGPLRTFKVTAKRAFRKFPYDSMQLNYEVGGFLLEQFPQLTVDVHHPDLEIRLDVREEGTFIFGEKIKGLGGYPLGSNGKAMLLLSGGIDSPVAGWLAMRRGLRIEAVHFHSYPFTSERAQQKVIDLTKVLAQYAGTIRLHMVPFTEIQTGLRKDAPPSMLITLMRRVMMQITERLAEQNAAQAIVTGENLGQVASQTLPSLHVIGHDTTLPILRPLITMDKQEIIDKALQIKTYPISILPYEDCCTVFLPKFPSTNPDLKRVQQKESQLDWLPELLEKAINDTETLYIKFGEVEQQYVDLL